MPVWCVIGWMCFGWNPSLVHASTFACVIISGLHCVTSYAAWLFKCLWSSICMTSYGVSIFSLGVVYVSPVYVAPCFMIVRLSMLMCEVMVSYVGCLPSGRASWFMYWSHDGYICLFCMWWVWGVFYVLGLLGELGWF